ncbi:MAG: glycosyltransferase [Planctomycetota bacterium]|nr:glycosyltransferase [Planctomycetota bacterium]
MSLSPAKAAQAAQARALLAQGKGEQARAAALRLAQGSPRSAEAALLVADVCESLGAYPQALHWAQRAAELAPADAGVQERAGYLASVEGDARRAEALLRAALALEPGRASARQHLAGALCDARRFSDARDLLRAGLALEPGHVGLASMLAGTLLNLARVDEALDVIRVHAAQHPDSAGLAMGEALLLNYADVPAGEVFAAHRRFGEALSRSITDPPFAHANTRDPARRLRVGVVSPDLRAHSVAAFAAPILRHHDREAIDLVVYQTNYASDDVTARLRTLGGAWRVMDTATDDALARAIHADSIDVLIELSGLTHGHSLPALARRPAPVIVTYMGYPNTTGLGGVSERWVDAHTDPPGAEAFCVERLRRLDPCFLCYDPPADAPAPAPRAADAPVTFGSFNSAQKISSATVALWRGVLGRVPGARLLLKAVNFEDAALRDDLRARLAQGGIAADRVELRPPVRDKAGHLAAYADVDIALDPFPYHGTTTTCEALWMGVPVVTRAGDRHASRVGATLLHAVGRPEWIAPSDEAFIEIAARLAHDRGALARERMDLRERVRASPLCDQPAFCRRFEGAIRDAWRAWCDAASTARAGAPARAGGGT